MNKEKEYSIRIDRILDLISSFGFEVNRGVISPSDCINMKTYHKLYNQYYNYDLIDLNEQTFHIKEIKNWVFNITLLQPTKPYDPEAVIWGMWIPGINSNKYSLTQTPYMVMLKIDPHGKENNHFWDNDNELKKMFVHIIKNKWISRYYSINGEYNLFNYITPHKAKRAILIKQYKYYKKISKYTKTKDFIIKYSIPFNKLFKNIGKNIITVYQNENTYNIIINTDYITDKYKNKLETLAYKNKINLKIVMQGADNNGEEN